jgi:cellulose synthase (UDP-forming)
MATKSDGIVKVNPPSKSELTVIRILISTGIASMLAFIYWFTDPEHVGYAPVFWLLTSALIFKLVKMIHEWYHYWSPSVPVMPKCNRQYTVDILTTACPGEPQEMIIRTLKAMKAITYPHTNYLCDEGNDPILKKVCDELGIIHVTRTIKKDAKAGNINNALLQAKGEICVVLDPDHVPIPEFLDRVLPYFEDQEIGYVQSVQAYGNQEESFIAKGAAEQTYHFYGPMMMCMNTYGTVQAIGANCVFRRSALDSIGGHAAGLSEDMHTAMQLHAKGWKSIYVPEILTRGLVPATLSSYYKQQLKWSRGTFELLFRTFPLLYNKFTWRQKIHYFTIPLYFLFGLINLIDIAVPIIALGFAEVPWEVNLTFFGMYFLPLCTISLVIRLYAQRWLLEKHERGFHFAGGVLRLATWWIFLVGFIYTIFKIKVPYIPTPKEDEHQNYIRLSVPNIITLITCTLLVVYGLSIDWTPYSLAMASYSLLTMSMLGFTIIMSQQKFLISVKSFITKTPTLNLINILVRTVTQRSQEAAYTLLRNGPVMVILALSVFFLSYSNIDETPDEKAALIQKELGGFYFGINGKSAESVPFNLSQIEETWGDTSASQLRNHLKNGNKSIIPYLILDANKCHSSNINYEIRRGAYDEYLTKLANEFRRYSEPLFLTYMNDSVKVENQEQFKLAWQYLYTFFNDLGISNLTWVWVPSSPKSENLYPGEKFVDWIGVNCLNYAENNKKKDWYFFKDIYEPYRATFGKFKKPVLANIGCVKSETQQIWISEALRSIRADYNEIKATVIFAGQKSFNIIDSTNSRTIYTSDFDIQPNTLSGIRTELQDEYFAIQAFDNGSNFKPAQNYRSAFIKGRPGKFELLIGNKPYYIKGVAYNTAHDWRDGNMPLTRRQVERDFQKIKEMGANTIRRYGHGIYDRNVLNIADEFDLNVLYGFWFDPKTDFYSDSLKVAEYISDVEEKVLEYRDHPAVMAWSLGNESWGLLKHRYAKPYLVKVRNSYIRMIEQLAQRIHELDPTRPVFSCIEHEEYQLPGELVAFRDGAPSIDAIGVNSYYREQISRLNHTAWQFDSLRPYIVSEFGPTGYWDPKYNNTQNSSIIEETDAEKATWYKHQWLKYVDGHKGYNIGGFAYCWHDRMEGSFTWFGITDYKGRVKPAYYALKEVWTNNKSERLPEFLIEAPGKIIPGKKYDYVAVQKGSNSNNWKYEWRLLKDEYLDKVDNIEVSEDPARISVTIPETPSDYRLYLFVTDESNQKVTTASVPVKVTLQNKQ